MATTDRPRLLVVDDDRRFVEAATVLARVHNFDSQGAHSLSDAREAIERHRFDLILVDLGLPDGSGFDLVEEFAPNGSPIAVVTGNASIDTAARAVRLPISDYLVKPLERVQFSALLDRAQSNWSMQRKPPPDASSCGDFIGTSVAMQEVYRQIRRVATAEANVLLIGESGTGKELGARAIHELSGRAGPFVAVNCGALAPELLASHLFGHERGSFTGAVRQHRGHFEQADGGTLLLDEITEMPLALQVHLLRVLETRSVMRVGGTLEHAVNVRVVGATNRRPEDAIAAGQLREDLYFRLAEFSLTLPPLRDRSGDIAQIAESLLAQLNRRYGTEKRFAEDALAHLTAYRWPGNVRELRNAVHRAYILSDGASVNVAAISEVERPARDDGALVFQVGTRLDVMEREMLLRTLTHFNGDKVRTAKALGVSVKTIYNHLARHSGHPGAGDIAARH